MIRYFKGQQMHHSGDKVMVLTLEADIDEQNRILSNKFRYYVVYKNYLETEAGNEVLGYGVTDHGVIIENNIWNQAVPAFTRLNIQILLDEIKFEQTPDNVDGEYLFSTYNDAFDFGKDLAAVEIIREVKEPLIDIRILKQEERESSGSEWKYID